MQVLKVCSFIVLSMQVLYCADGGGRPRLRIDTRFVEASEPAIPEGFTEEDCTRAARGVTQALSRAHRAFEDDSVTKDVRFFESVEKVIQECADFLTRPGIKDLYEACNEAKEVGYDSDLTNLDHLKARFAGIEWEDADCLPVQCTYAAASPVESVSCGYDADGELSSAQSETEDELADRPAGKKRGRKNHVRGHHLKAARKEKQRRRKKDN